MRPSSGRDAGVGREAVGDGSLEPGELPPVNQRPRAVAPAGLGRVSGGLGCTVALPRPVMLARPRNRLSPRGVALAVLAVVALLVPAIYLVARANAPEQATGFVLDVRTRPSLGVDSFDLLAGDGRTLTFQVGELDVSDGFDAGHLVTHKVTLQPVIVSYRHDGARLVAVRLADGPLPPSPATPSASG